MVKTLVRRARVIAALLALTACLCAQSKTIYSDSETITGIVEAIDRSSRTVTVKHENGEYEVLAVPETMRRFSEIKVGDRLTGTYYENVIVRLKASGEKDVDSAAAALTRGSGEKPAGTVASQRVITATITQIDAKTPSLTFEGPNGWSYSSRIRDKKVLKQIKVGDKVDITWTAAVLVSLDTPKR